jgi:hypothetical protein
LKLEIGKEKWVAEGIGEGGHFLAVASLVQ